MNNIVDLNPSQIAMDPLLFHELEKSDILYKLTSEFRYSEEEAIREFESATAILTRLKPIRNSQSKTDDYLLEVLSALRLRVKTFIIMHLLRSTETNDTYCHAYNNFVYYANRYLRLDFHRKEISERELQVLLGGNKVVNTSFINYIEGIKGSSIINILFPYFLLPYFLYCYPMG